jgi:beta-N-acetylglucosaminidase
MIDKNRKVTEVQTEQLTALLQQLEQLELIVSQRQAVIEKMYERVLVREGRLSEKHILGTTVSRLVGGPTNQSVGISRSQPRYSPYQFDITLPSAVTAYELEQVLAGTGLAGLGRDFIRAELIFGINAMFLTALAIHESQWGKSGLASDKHNLFGFGAYDADPYRFAESFESKSDCILQVAQFVREQYVDGGLSRGRSIADVNRKYASDPEWSHKVFGLMLEIDRSLTSVGR